MGRIVLLLLLIPSLASCAYPITHVALAREWMVLHGPRSERAAREFIIGTLFPDIRYITGEERSKTHPTGVTLHDVLTALTPFEAGRLFHCYVDDQRAAWLHEWKIHDLLGSVPPDQRGSILKLVEDEITFERRKHASVSDFLLIPYEEATSGHSRATLVKWHTLLGTYFRAKPSSGLKSLRTLRKGIFHLSPKVVAQWAALLPEVAQRPEMEQYVNRLFAAFQQEFASIDGEQLFKCGGQGSGYIGCDHRIGSE